MNQAQLQARVKRLEYLANTADNTDEYCALMAKLHAARDDLRKVTYIGTVTADRRCPMCGGVDCQSTHDRY